MGLQGVTGQHTLTHTHTQKQRCLLAVPKRSISFCDIIICVITYQAIKQTSVSISSPAISPLFLSSLLVLFSPASASPLLSSFLFNLLLPPLLSSPSAPHPPLLCDSRQGFNFSMLIVSLPTLCMSNTYQHSGDRQYTPQNAYYTPTRFY